MIAVVAALTAALAAGVQTEAAPRDSAWTWTLYTDSAPVVLAQEIPDTASLRTTLECEPGAGLAQVTVYGGAPMQGLARLTAGLSTAVSEAEAGPSGSSRLAIRTDHPAFAAFSLDGRLAIAVGDQRRAIEVPAAHLAKLRRFAELCSG